MNKTQISCPNWASVGSYEDCEYCPSFSTCQDETMIRLYENQIFKKRLWDFKEKISKLWSEETKYPKSKRNAFNSPARGQCYVTAFVAWTVFGGEIVKGDHHGEDHYWNRFVHYGEVDFTSSQYGGNDMDPWIKAQCVIRTRDWDNPRVRLLLEKYRSSLGKVNKDG